MADLRQGGADEAPSPELEVLHLEDDFVAVSKPSGLLVHRDEHHPDAPAALQLVRDQLERHLYPFHRLDRATSGILLFGLSKKAAAALQGFLVGAEVGEFHSPIKAAIKPTSNFIKGLLTDTFDEKVVAAVIMLAIGLAVLIFSLSFLVKCK